MPPSFDSVWKACKAFCRANTSREKRTSFSLFPTKELGGILGARRDIRCAGLAPNIPSSSFVGKRLKLVLFSREVFARQNALHAFQTESNEGGPLPSLRPQASLH